ncbi:MAG: hypothetical protein COV78_03370 [Candidatus Pacebacteria bacterium CG11_big_fil_rev_8_21_14_0_20_34_55]|nr:hypothetical protein [Candidatus Pacearchaeota archaeon]NCQ65345.1 hypothetical protein [Candidatus Paceibacterota bacterium]NCS86243.1 hypothetical protein [Candidatus Paceibacterota bacterium]PIQ80863.1 MAG: hypothetical protein COV78_03370 [Candidatus Pacebacteria bacterium CG11_big_fil_rev_8_21_14_0_20_34_55]
MLLVENLSPFLRERALRTWASLNLFFQREQTDFLPADRLRFSPTEISIFPQTKPTNIGLGLLSVLGAEKLQTLDSNEANRRLKLMLESLKNIERFNGFFYDWYDSKSKKKLDKWPEDGHALDLLLSSVDNAWLALSLLIVAQAKPDLTELIQEEFLSKMNFDFFFDEKTEETFGGYSVSQSRHTENHYVRDLLSETRIVHWVHAALTTNKKQRVEILKRLLSKQGTIPNKLAGGALFELLMPRLFIREKYLDVALHQIFDEHLGYGNSSLDGMVGISVADNPNAADRYTEMGVGGMYPSSSIISAHGVVLAFLARPEIALKTISTLELIPGFYNEHGYKDAVDIRSGKTTQTQVFINQAMVFLCLISLEDSYFTKLFSKYFTDEEELAFSSPKI